MSGEVVNLRQARKRAARAARETAAETSRRRYGTSKAAKHAEIAERARLDRQLDGARLEPGETLDARSDSSADPEHDGEAGR